MTKATNISLEAIDQMAHLHPVSSTRALRETGPRIFNSASGVLVKDSLERESLDMGAGLWCVNVGYGRQELVDAGADALGKLSFQHHFTNSACPDTIRLAERLVTLFRETTGAGDIVKALFGTSGSDANDTALKLVRYYHNSLGKPAKKKILARMGGYHGLTMASGSLTGIPGYHKLFDLPIEGILHISCPHFYRYGRKGETEVAYTARLLLELEELIIREGPETIGGFIAEPIMGTGGVIMPPEGYFEGVQALLTRHDILLIVDEVITGFGRTGHWFGSEAYGLKPDIVSLAKGLTSAYFPMSASLISQRVFDAIDQGSDIVGSFMHGFTYSGHPVGSAIALANLNVLAGDGLIEKTSENGPYLINALQNAIGDNPFVGDIRGLGLMIGVEFVADRESRESFPADIQPHQIVSRYAAEEGVLSRALPFLPVNAFSPPLNITRDEIDAAVEGYARGLKKATDDLHTLLR